MGKLLPHRGKTDCNGRHAQQKIPVKQVEALTVGTRREANAGKSKNCGRLTVKWREIQVRTTQNGGKQVKLSKQQRKMAEVVPIYFILTVGNILNIL